MPAERLKILFIGVGFYDYDEAIVKGLKSMGHDVDYLRTVYPKSKSEKLLSKTPLKHFYQKSAEKKTEHAITGSRRDNDAVLIIKGENLSAKAVDLLRERNPKARFALYLWDNLNKIANRDILLPNFDKISVFDPTDIPENPGFHYRPLFYLKRGHQTGDYDYDLSFIGENRPGRYKTLTTLSKTLPSGMKLFFRLKSSVLLTIADRMAGRHLCSNKPLPYDEFCSIMDRSKGILDIEETGQHGLTMRSIEALAMGKHLYTTNDEIARAPYVNPDSFTVIHPDGDAQAVDARAGGQDEEFYRYYGLNQFLTDILP